MATRILLQGDRPAVLRRFARYISLTVPSNLQAMPASPFALPHNNLEGCYSDSNNLSILKTDIKENQPVLLRGECQYCNIGEPNTFDHYLPKSLFPEFSAFSKNLVPCCSFCNTEKGQKWIITGSKAAISLYFDSLPAVQYLSCTISYRRALPVANYSLNSALIPGYMSGVVANHYTELKLLTRYSERSNSIITDVFEAISPQAGRLTKAQIQAQLINEATAMQGSRGLNYWRAVTKIALANSNTFLRTAGFP
jgi:hypothetical protein